MGLVEVGGGPQGALRSLEKVFDELVLGAKWVEEGALRKKLVRESIRCVLQVRMSKTCQWRGASRRCE